MSRLIRVIQDIDVTRPTTPADLAADPVSETEINLSWSAATDPAGLDNEANTGVSGYRLYRGGSLVVDQAGLTYSDDELDAFTSYDYTVSSYDGAGNESIQSAIVTAKTLDETAPTAPVLTAEATGESTISVDLDTASTDAMSGVDSYQLEYKLTAGSTWTVESSSLEAVDFPYEVSGLTAETAYDFRARATDVSGNVGSYSTTVQETTESSQDTVVPEWTNTFENLELTVGQFYSIDLADYGADIERAYAIGWYGAYGDTPWPTGMSYDPETCILSGTPTVADEMKLPVLIGQHGEFDAEAEWAYLSGLSGVYTAQDFPDDDSVRDVSDNMSGNPDRSIWDSDVKLFGNGSLRMEILDTDAYSLVAEPGDTGAPGNYRVPLIGGAWNDNFGEPPQRLQVGEEAWAMCLIRYNEAEVKWEFAGSGGGVIHQLKLMMVDQEGGSSKVQVAVNPNFALIEGFTGVGTGLAWDRTQFDSRCRTNDIKLQPEVDSGIVDPLTGTDPGLPSGSGAGQPWTNCQQDRARYGGLRGYYTQGRLDKHPDPLTGGIFLPIDYWLAVQVHVKRVATEETLVECWALYLGQDWTLIYSSLDPVGEDTDGDTYCIANFTNSHTDMLSEAGVRPKCERWYDGVITRSGSERIPAPGFQS